MPISSEQVYKRLRESCPELMEKSEKMGRWVDKTIADEYMSLYEKCKKGFPDLFKESGENSAAGESDNIGFIVERAKNSPTTVQKFGAARLHIDIDLEAVCSFIYLMGSHRTQSNIDLAKIMCS